MVLVNYSTMQVAAKIVYYGPGLCGKTTNLQWIHRKTAPASRGEMISLETDADRTLFFDLLPLEVGMIAGMKVRLQLYTVPGQVFYNATRRLVLKGVDGVVFVADSQVPALDANEESLENLSQNLEELGVDPPEMPVVFQYNKRDLSQIVPVERLQHVLNRRGLPSFEAAAVRGIGVFETLKEISRQALDSVRTRIAADTARPGVRRKKARQPTAPPVAPAWPSETDHSRLEPLEIEFAEEATDSIGVRPVPTQDSADIERLLGRIREAPAPALPMAARSDDEPLQVQFGDLGATDTAPPEETDHFESIEVPEEWLRGLTDVRVHLGLNHDGIEDVLHDAVRIKLVQPPRRQGLRVRLDLELRRKDGSRD